MRKALILTTALAGLLLAPPLAWADQPAPPPADNSDDVTQVDALIISASRGDAVRKGDLGASVTVITSDQMEDRGTRTLADVLRDVPGVAVNREGPLGQLDEVRIRGAEANHTLVLIDGIDASDPFQGEFDFSTLIADDVAHVEVLRGQQSALYGAQAIGGVVSYITATGAEAPGLRGRVEAGSDDTLSAAIRQAGVSGKVDYALSAAGYTTNGQPGAVGGVRDVGYSDYSLSGKTTLSLSDTVRLKAVVRYSDTRADDIGEDFATDPNTFQPVNPATYGRFVDGTGSFTNRALLSLVRGEASFLDGRLTTALTLQDNDTERREYDAGAFTFGSDGTRVKGSAEATYRFGGEATRQSLTLALDDKRETYRNVPDGAPGPINLTRVLSNIGYVAEYEGRFGDHLGVGLSARHDQNDRFKNADTWRGQVSYSVNNALRLRAAAGTGLAAPTNFELFGFDPSSFVGNPNLRPESSGGWEAGADLTPSSRRYSLSLTYFHSVLKDEIFTAFLPGFLSTPENRTTLSTQDGIEASASARLGDSLTAHAAWTHLSAQEGGGLPEIRRPDDSGSTDLTWKAPGARTSATLTVRYTGQFRDFDFTDPNAFPTPRRVMPAYTLVALSVSHKIGEGMELFGRVDNLFDQAYQEQYTARSPGRTAVIGVRKGF